MDHLAATAAYFDGWNARDAGAVLETLSTDGTYEDPGTSGPISGTAFRDYMERIWRVFPDLWFEIASQTDDGAAAQWIMRGTNLGPFRGVPPTGRAFEVRGADFFTFDEAGRIASVTGYFDGGALPRQLGFEIVLRPPEGAAT